MPRTAQVVVQSLIGGIIVLCFTSVANARGKEGSKNTALTTVDLPCTQVRVHRVGSLWHTVTNYGILGTFNNPNVRDPESGLPAPSCEFPGGSGTEYLFMGALWVGGVVGADTLVSTGHDGWLGVSELFPDPCPQGQMQRILSGSPADREYVALFTDTVTLSSLVDPDQFSGRPHKPLNIQITQRTRSWATPPFDRFIIYENWIKNIGAGPISSAFAAIYWDGDVWPRRLLSQGFKDDVTGFIDSLKLAWLADQDGDGESGVFREKRNTKDVMSVKILGGSVPSESVSYNWWISEGTNPVDQDWGPQRLPGRRNYSGGYGTPEGDVGKYRYMSEGEKDYDQLTLELPHPGWIPPPKNADSLVDGFDTRFLLSVGPFDIAPGESVQVGFAVVAGKDFHVGANDFRNTFPPGNFSGFKDSATVAAFYSLLNFDSLVATVQLAQATYASNYRLPPPGPPEGLRVDTWTDSTVTLGWNPSGIVDVFGYNVYRSTDSTFAGPPLNATLLPTNGFVDTTVTRGVLYLYAVSAVDSGLAEGKKSLPVSVLAGQPEIPQGLSAVGGRGEVTLFWAPNPEPDIDHYNIYRSTAPNLPFGNIGSTTGAETTFVDQTVQNGVVYRYQISAVRVDGLASFLSPIVFGVPMAFDQGLGLVDLTFNGFANLVNHDSVIAFYNRALRGYQFSLLNFSASIDATPSLANLSPYPVLLLASEDLRYPLPDSLFRVLSFYRIAGGKVLISGQANFSFYSYTDPNRYNDIFNLSGLPPQMLFAVDSAYAPRPAIYLAFTDSLKVQREFIGAQPKVQGYPLLEVDTARLNRYLCVPFVPPRCLAHNGTLPAVEYFFSADTSEDIYTFVSRYPDTSHAHGKAVAKRKITPGYSYVFFDLPLFFMKEAEAKAALKAGLADLGLTPTPYTVGDVNNNGAIDIADIAQLVQFVVFATNPPQPFEFVGDTNCDGLIDIVDIVLLLQYVLYGQPPLCL